MQLRILILLRLAGANYLAQNVHSLLFGGETKIGGIQDFIFSTYNRAVLPVDTENMAELTMDDFENMDHFIKSECTKYKTFLQDEKLILDTQEVKHEGAGKPQVGPLVMKYDEDEYYIDEPPSPFSAEQGPNVKPENINWTDLDNMTQEELADAVRALKSFPPYKNYTECQIYLKTHLLYDTKTSGMVDFVQVYFSSHYSNTRSRKYGDIYLNTGQDYIGKKVRPVHVDVMVQIQNINSVNLYEEYFDATISIYMSWFDFRLKWDPMIPLVQDTRYIQVTSTDIWIPDLEISNRRHDFSPSDEKVAKATISHVGKVSFTRLYRMRASFSTDIKNYPYDVQTPELLMSSIHYSNKKVLITTKRWNMLNGLDRHLFSTKGEDTMLSVLLHDEYVNNSEWQLSGYNYMTSTKGSIIKKANFSTLAISFKMQRNDPFYTLTIFIPILIMTLIAPIGLILPIQAGEKMGLQITVMLTMVIYIQMLQSTFPVFNSYGQTPRLLTYFIASVVLMGLCLLVSTHTVFLHHVSPNESKNFTRTEAVISVYMAKFFNIIALGFWDIETPANTKRIAYPKDDEFHDKLTHDELSFGFQFYADMLNRAAMFIIVLMFAIFMSTTLIPQLVIYNDQKTA